MRKAILLFLFICSACGLKAQEFKAKVTYQVTLDNEGFHNRLVNDTSITEVSKKANLKEIASTKPANFHLIIHGDEALYQAEYDIETKISLGLMNNRTDLVAQDFMVYYTNFQTDESYFQSYFTKEALVDLDKIDWTLTQETKKIGEYICYKATATIDSKQLFGMNFMGPIVAWYTPQIPVSFGIKEFIGLPGLTMELVTDYEKGKLFYYVTKIELNPKEDIEIKKPKGRRHISQRDYLEMIGRLNNARKSNRP